MSVEDLQKENETRVKTITRILQDKYSGSYTPKDSKDKKCKRDKIPFDAGRPNIEAIIKDNKLEQLFPIQSDEGVGADDIKVSISCDLTGAGLPIDITISKKYCNISQ